MEKPLPIEKVKAALIAVRPKISEPQMSMLRAHYLYRTLSMRRIARELGFATPGQQMHTIAETVPERDSEGEWQWRLDDVLVKALDETGCFSHVAEETLERAQYKDVPETEREAVIKARVGQGNFRTDVIALWGSCAVTGCTLCKVLIASHLVPWAACATDQERLDKFNGLLLTPNLDRLVDSFLISFNDDGTILLSKHLSVGEGAILGVSEQSKMRFVPPAMLPYLKRHRTLFLEKQG